MPDDLGEYDEEMSRRNTLTELDLEGLFNSDSMTDNDVAQRELAARGLEDPFRSSLAGLFANHRVLLRELHDKVAEVAESAKQINLRAGMVLIGYTGGGRLQKWLVRRAWKRIASFHNISLSSLLSDMPKGHCADHWECKHDPEVDCNEVAEERRGLEQAQAVVQEATGGQSNAAFLELMNHTEGLLEGRENLQKALDTRLGSAYHELARDELVSPGVQRTEYGRLVPFPQPLPAKVEK